MVLGYLHDPPNRMTFPYLIKTRDALVFTIPSQAVVNKIEEDAEATQLRVRAAARVLERNVRRVNVLLDVMPFEILPVADRSERLIRLFLPPPPHLEATLASSTPTRYTLPSYPHSKPTRTNYKPKLATIPEEAIPSELQSSSKNNKVSQTSKTLYHLLSYECRSISSSGLNTLNSEIYGRCGQEFDPYVYSNQ